MASTSTGPAPPLAVEIARLVSGYAMYEARFLISQRILEYLVRDDTEPAAFEEHRRNLERMREESQQGRDEARRGLMDRFRTKMSRDLFFRDDSLHDWFNVLWASSQEDLFGDRDVSATGFTAGELARIVEPLERILANPHSFRTLVGELLKPFRKEETLFRELKKLWYHRMEYRVRQELYAVASQHAAHDELVDAEYWIREVGTTLERVNLEMGATYGRVAGDIVLQIENDVANVFAEQWPRFVEAPWPVSDEPRWQYAQLKRDFPRFLREHLDVTEQQLAAYINTVWESQQ
ncbi:hypothetical protein DL765_011326 [Monosporascus sp. GIB2]|nr:hypothetical protein DL765_011326 [Monosporascus sp. GIB2]